MKKILLAILGALLILVGIAGILLPVVPGWALIFLGLSFSAPKFTERLKRRFFRKFFKKGIIELKDWRKFSVKAEFTTKHFQLLLKKTEELSEPKNQEQFQKLIPGKKFVFLNQVHQNHIEVLEDESKYAREGFYHLSGTDGVLTNIEALTLLVMTADCLPIFLCAKSRRAEKADWIGIIHTGWRGTKEGIAKKAYQLILEKSKCSDAGIHVVFGPAIRRDHYEVGAEFKNYFGGKFIHKRSGKFYFDLAAENKRQLIKAGALEENILDLDICTVCENESFYSFRKEQAAAGRTLSLIAKI